MSNRTVTCNLRPDVERVVQYSCDLDAALRKLRRRARRCRTCTASQCDLHRRFSDLFQAVLCQVTDEFNQEV